MDLKKYTVLIFMILLLGCNSNTDKKVNDTETSSFDEISEGTVFENDKYKIIYQERRNNLSDSMPNFLSSPKVYLGDDFMEYLVEIGLDAEKPISSLEPLVEVLENENLDALISELGNDHLQDLSWEDQIYTYLNNVNVTKDKFFEYRNDKLVLSLENQKEVILESTFDEDSTKTFYSFSQFLPSINYYLISVNEKPHDNNSCGIRYDASYLLVNCNNGFTQELWDAPSISPNKEKIVIASYGWGCDYVKLKGFQILSIQNDSLSIDAEFKDIGWEPSVIGWLSNSKLLIKTNNEGDYIAELELLEK